VRRDSRTGRGPIESYLQTVVIGVLLILAVVADQFRLRYIASLQD